MSVRMTEIAPPVFSRAPNIDVPVEELFAETRFDFGLISGDSGSVETPVESGAFTQVGQILGKMIVSNGLVADDVTDVPSTDIEHSKDAGPEFAEIALSLPTSEPVPRKEAAKVDDESREDIDEIHAEVNQSIMPANNVIRTADSDKTLTVHMRENRVQQMAMPIESAKINAVVPEKFDDPDPGVAERSSAQGDGKNQHVGPPSVQPFGISNETFELKNIVTAVDSLQNISEVEVVNLVQPSTLRTSPALAPTIQTAAGGIQAPDSKILAQISSAISSTSKDTVEIRLDPPELGRVIISINQSESGLSALVSSEKAEIADLLRRHSELLSRELAKSGYEGATLEFSHHERRPDDSEFEFARNSYSSDPAEQNEAKLEIEKVLRSISGGLDIRL